jgi:hypothetical protein
MNRKLFNIKVTFDDVTIMDLKNKDIDTIDRSYKFFKRKFN